MLEKILSKFPEPCLSAGDVAVADGDIPPLKLCHPPDYTLEELLEDVPEPSSKVRESLAIIYPIMTRCAPFFAKLFLQENSI